MSEIPIPEPGSVVECTTEQILEEVEKFHDTTTRSSLVAGRPVETSESGSLKFYSKSGSGRPGLVRVTNRSDPGQQTFTFMVLRNKLRKESLKLPNSDGASSRVMRLCNTALIRLSSAITINSGLEISANADSGCQIAKDVDRRDPFWRCDNCIEAAIENNGKIALDPRKVVIVERGVFFGTLEVRPAEKSKRLCFGKPGVYISTVLKVVKDKVVPVRRSRRGATPEEKEVARPVKRQRVLGFLSRLRTHCVQLFQYKGDQIVVACGTAAEADWLRGVFKVKHDPSFSGHVSVCNRCWMLILDGHGCENCAPGSQG